ncbi:PAS-domain containing protein [Sneathiella sp.]|jgi:two-component system cell cycle sensor histidine kinase PleC|uniref:sensor histidine kinase n=1 Tax=Sneathiella sp. TaxID=1964365 RepID=UPI0039E36A1A
MLDITLFSTIGLSIGLAMAICSSVKSKTKTNEAGVLLTQCFDAVEALDEGFLLFDKDRKVIVGNKTVDEMLDGIGISITAGVTRNEISDAIRKWLADEGMATEPKKELDRAKINLASSRKAQEWALPNGKVIQVLEKETKENGLISVFTDITETHQKKEELYEKSALLSNVFETIAIGICVLDSTFRVVRWNQNYMKIMDVEPNTIFKGIHMQQLLEAHYSSYDEVGDSPEDYAASAIRALQANIYTKIERKTKSGKIVEIQRSKLPDGGYICTFTDITLTKTAQLMLQESETRHREMVELSPDAILVQKDGLIIYANVSAIKLFGERDLHSLIGKQARKFFPTNDYEHLKQHLGNADHMEPGDNIPPIETRTINQFGKQTDVEVEATALLYGGRPVMQLILRDISAQKEAEEILLKAKEEAEYVSQMKGTFLANMSHELRTPLNAVIGFSEIIRNEIFGKIGHDKYIEYATDIHASGRHLLDLINDILDLSKVEAGTQQLFEEELDFAELVNECVRLTHTQQEASNIVILNNLSGFPLFVHADAKMIKQVVINLLSNAIKFTPNGGQISLFTEYGADGSLNFYVKDTGIGIREDDIQKALTPFVQVDSELNRKYNGTGLGLPLSKNLMELHEGSLTLDSVYGKGTTVTVTLPQKRVTRSAA